MIFVLRTLLLFYLLLVIGTNATGAACGQKGSNLIFEYVVLVSTTFRDK
jgi:hypothetical protein